MAISSLEPTETTKYVPSFVQCHPDDPCRVQRQNLPVTDVIWSVDSSYLLAVYNDNNYHICEYRTQAIALRKSSSSRVGSVVRTGQGEEHSEHHLAASRSPHRLQHTR